MIPVLTAAEMRLAEENTFSAEILSSLDAMEAAGHAAAEVCCERYRSRGKKVCILCGAGNNGGDGYVIARLLWEQGFAVTVLSIAPFERQTVDTKATCEAWRASGHSVALLTAENWGALLEEGCSDAAVIVDALFGTGFTGPFRENLSEFFALFAATAKRHSVPIFAVDIPSGVDADSGSPCEHAVIADATITFQAVKPGLVLYPGAVHVGDLYLADIGISLATVPNCGLKNIITRADVSRILNENLVAGSTAHKGKKGHVAVIGGSEGHYGAPKLSARAALRSGAGLVTLVLPKSVSALVAPLMMELMVAGLPDTGSGTFEDPRGQGAEMLSGKRACVIGPGIGKGDGARALLREVLVAAKSSSCALVIDADGLNQIAEEVSLLEVLPKQTVLTPHPGEMARLVNQSIASVESNRLAVASAFASKTASWIVLKGAHTVIAGPNGEIYINPIATAALATAGSGDVLAGFIGSFLAQGFSVSDAVIAAVFVHGSCGLELVTSKGIATGIVAGDLIEQVPEVLASIVHSLVEKQCKGTITLVLSSED